MSTNESAHPFQSTAAQKLIESLSRHPYPGDDSLVQPFGGSFSFEIEDVASNLRSKAWQDLDINQPGLDVLAIHIAMTAAAFVYYLPAFLGGLLVSGGQFSESSDYVFDFFVPPKADDEYRSVFDERMAALTQEEKMLVRQVLLDLIAFDPDIASEYETEEVRRIRKYWKIKIDDPQAFEPDNVIEHFREVGRLRYPYIAEIIRSMGAGPLGKYGTKEDAVAVSKAIIEEARTTANTTKVLGARVRHYLGESQSEIIWEETV